LLSDTVILLPESAVPERPGWYPDPDNCEMQRWFDGSQWTMEAVPIWEPDPDQLVQRKWSMYAHERQPVGSRLKNFFREMLSAAFADHE
jgi:hypothetical protein